ncbi:disulfide bond formation protein DsbA [Hyphomicrobium methylovorum]|uniref:2-hydroxychromene-2-carboxylate isomerase n=1 Tax=Hyphomicrobium methylovorum TaxID=84 RepID=UPI0015E6A9A8|nr:2-hydroxychromene-2-carboxylate isomerase [Hyphomicrobium methylovorum]MBA2126194.1 disulfide bond formation protein DsbA [Hyphomicrobium methylovorum]
MQPTVQFWYEFASTYSYLAAMRIEAVAKRSGVRVVWRPFLLGPIFKSQGWTTSPFNIYPLKGRYMVRDIERVAAARGLEFQMPPVFPANGLKAARLAIAASHWDGTADFSRAVYGAAFGRGLDIGNDDVLRGCLAAAQLPVESVWAESLGDDVKGALRSNTEDAQARGIFGAPSFTTDDNELFWGDDRLDQAIAWAARAAA